MTDQGSGLDNPAYAAFVWRRFRRLLWWMALAASICASVAYLALTHVYGPFGWVATLTTIVGVWMTVMLAAVLMGLAFLSSGSGHDETVQRGDFGT